MFDFKTPFVLLAIAGGFGALDSLPRTTDEQRLETPGGVFTHKQLGRVLAELGFNAEPYESRLTGLRGYSVTFARGDWQIVMNIGLSRDKTVIWLFAPLSQVTDIADLSAVPLLAMLARNGTMGLAHFSYDAESGILFLEFPVPIGLATPAHLKTRIETLADLVRDTVELWDVRRWRRK